MFDLEKLTAYAPFCFSCIGRTVGRIGFGLDNRERGLEMLNQLELQDESAIEGDLICSSSECKICDGLIDTTQAIIPNTINLVARVVDQQDRILRGKPATSNSTCVAGKTTQVSSGSRGNARIGTYVRYPR